MNASGSFVSVDSRWCCKLTTFDDTRMGSFDGRQNTPRYFLASSAIISHLEDAGRDANHTPWRGANQKGSSNWEVFSGLANALH
jgi:hypothetical protein